MAQNVDAIEYKADTVDPHLKTNPKFSLFEGDVIHFKFDKVYDMAIYGAVHHHAFGLHGYNAAMQFWNALVDHTETRIFFETGQLAEGSRWYWQRTIRSIYNSDERYIGELLTAIGPRFKSVSTIGRYSIHGVRRCLLKIELWPRQTNAPAAAENTEKGIECSEVLWRTVGSKRQKLQSARKPASQGLFEGVRFGIGATTDGHKVFCKKYTAGNMQAFESSIGAQIKDPRFITAEGESNDHGLIFPLIEGTPLVEITRDEIPDKNYIKNQLLSIRQYAIEKKIEIDFSGKKSYRLIDLVDMHPSNCFVIKGSQNIRLFDLEFYSTQNASRNEYKLAQSILRLGPWDAASIAGFMISAIRYGIYLAKVPFMPIEQRIEARADNCLARVYIFSREVLDRAIRTLFPKYWQ